MSWILNTPPPDAYGFSYIIDADNGHVRRLYAGHKKFLPGWENYNGTGLLIKAWCALFGPQTLTKRIIGLHATKREAADAEADIIIQFNAVESSDWLNLVNSFRHGWNDPRERDLKVLTQMASWYPPKARNERRRVVAATPAGLKGWKSAKSAAEGLSLSQSLVINACQGRRKAPGTTTAIRYLPDAAINQLMLLNQLQWMED